MITKSRVNTQLMIYLYKFLSNPIKPYLTPHLITRTRLKIPLFSSKENNNIKIKMKSNIIKMKFQIIKMNRMPHSLKCSKNNIIHTIIQITNSFSNKISTHLKTKHTKCKRSNIQNQRKRISISSTYNKTEISIN